MKSRSTIKTKKLRLPNSVMSTKISQILFRDKDKKYVASLRRSIAAMMDIWITLILRALVAQIAGSLFMNRLLSNFITDFKNEFGTDVPKDTPEHISYILHHPFFYEMLVFYAVIIMIGAVYHSYLNSSAWCGTIGKRAMKIMILRGSELPITFNRGLLHYFLSTAPFIFLFYILIYQLKHELNLYQAITASDLNIFFGFIFVFWVQIQMFTKKKTTAYDMISNTVLVNGRTGAKWPWSKS